MNDLYLATMHATGAEVETDLSGEHYEEATKFEPQKNEIGGGGVFVVTITNDEDNETYTIDKSYGEILDAIMDRRPIIAVEHASGVYDGKEWINEHYWKVNSFTDDCIGFQNVYFANSALWMNGFLVYPDNEIYVAAYAKHIDLLNNSPE